MRDRLEGIKPGTIMSKYNISSSAYYRIIQNEETTLKPSQKRVQRARYELINKKVSEVFDKIRVNGYPVSGPALKLLAENARRNLLEDPSTPDEDKRTYSSARFGDSWLDKFKAAHGARNLRVNGERASVPANVWTLMEPIIEEIRNERRDRSQSLINVQQDSVQ